MGTSPTWMSQAASKPMMRAVSSSDFTRAVSCSHQKGPLHQEVRVRLRLRLGPQPQMPVQPWRR